MTIPIARTLTSRKARLRFIFFADFASDLTSSLASVAGASDEISSILPLSISSFTSAVDTLDGIPSMAAGCTSSVSSVVDSLDRIFSAMAGSC